VSQKIMKIAGAKEVAADEHREALAPDVAAHLVKASLEVWLEARAGEPALREPGTSCP
jgi:NAD/NADP transhydrogenase alpha subunit